MPGEPELDSMREVLSALQPLQPDAQIRVVRWVVEKLGLSSPFEVATEQADAPLLSSSQTPGSEMAARLSQAATAWTKQNAVTASELESVFHVNNGEVAVIAAHISGKNNREKVLNCYVLSGVIELLRTGEPSFTDKSARALCQLFGCLDTTNHSKYLNEKGNEFTGSKEKGWTLTIPGRRRGAQLVKEIASASP